jgi:hypothetical protein
VVDFIRKELGNSITIEQLPGYNVRYSLKSMATNMMLQAPKMMFVYQSEHRIYQQLVKKHTPLFSISDNRYGCRCKKIPSYFLGHQWNILSKNGKINTIATRLNQFFIRKFDGMIVPDDTVLNLSGKLSQNITMPWFSCSGILSRFPILLEESKKKKLKVCIVLSGPEPSRTQLENNLLNHFSDLKETELVLIRGTKDGKTELLENSKFEIKSIVDSPTLQEIIKSAELLICRSGYSSIMDYITLGVPKIVFIPTAGQTEQMYLAKRMNRIYEIPFFDENHIHELDIEHVQEAKWNKTNSTPELINLLINRIEEGLELR